MIRCDILAGSLVLLAVITAFCGHAAAQEQAPNPPGCRAGAARNVSRLTHAGLRALDRCAHEYSGGEETDESCNVLPEAANTDYGRMESRLSTVVAVKCLPDDPTRENYPPCAPPCDNITDTILPETRAAMDTNQAALQAQVTLPPDSKGCYRVIGKARTRVARKVLRRSLDCQRRLDHEKGAQFGAIDPQCLATAGAAGTEAARKIGKRCKGFSGADVGSCDPLPDCVVGGAQTLGQALAKITYGVPASCGNGTVDPGEQCDDGNASNDDACTNDCHNAVCGDTFVWQGVEECDDGNLVDTDGCSNACKLPVCGDGIRAGTEECDDGNTTPDDGCTDCTIDPTDCGPGGLRAVVSYADPGNHAVAAGRMKFGYPSAVSIPGAAVASRVTNISSLPSGLFRVALQDADSDGTNDTVAIIFGTTDMWPTGNFAAIQFDCAAGTGLRPSDFTCFFDDASDGFSNPVDPSSLVCGVVLEPIP